MLAHRGLVLVRAADGMVAENSFAAFAAAHAAGAAYIETDCHLTADGHVVLCHDATLERVAGDPRRVADLTLAQFEALLADRGGAATLAQALEAFPTVRFNVDVKTPAAAVEAGRIVARHAERVLLTSFDDATRRKALDAAAGSGGRRPATSPGRDVLLRLVTAVALRRRSVSRRILEDVDALQIPERRGPLHILSPRLLDAAHDAGVEVHVWTVNDSDDMLRLIAAGVDGIVTDRADVALSVLGARPQA